MPALLAVGMIGWTVFWFQAAASTESLIDGWRDREARSGRAFDCGDRKLGGYPFRLEVRCRKTRFEWTSSVKPITAELTETLFIADAFDPLVLNAEFASPLRVSEANFGQGLTVSWKGARANLVGLPASPKSMALSFDGLTARLEAQSGPSSPFQANHAELRGQMVSGSPADNPVVEIALKLVAARAGAVHPFAEDSFDGDFAVTLRGLKDFSPKPWSMRLRELQANDGRIELTNARLRRRDMIAVATGALALTDQGRLNGELLLTVAGIERVLESLDLEKLLAHGLAATRAAAGVKPGDINKLLAAVDAVVPGLGNIAREQASSGLKAGLAFLGEKTTLEGQPALALPLRLVDGRVFLGPLDIGESPALF
jgi:hypothetical protein